MSTPLPTPNPPLSSTPTPTTPGSLAPPPTTSATTAVPGLVAPPGAGGQVLDGGVIVAIIAVLVSVFALLYSRRAAKANESMVNEAKAANRLHADEIALIRQHRQEDQDRNAAAATAATAARDAQARTAAAQISVQYGLNAGIDVAITNDSSRTIRNPRLVALTGEHPAWTWGPNPNIFTGNSPTGGRLAPHEHKTIACVFYDEQGVKQRTNGERYGSLVRFTDADGQRWEISDDAGPRQVPNDDTDLAPPATP